MCVGGVGGMGVCGIGGETLRGVGVGGVIGWVIGVCVCGGG